MNEREERRLLENLEKLIDMLLIASESGAAIIVEGKRDSQALRELGVKGSIIMAARRPALDLAESVAKDFDEIIILTDWDREGDELALKIEGYLRYTKAHADLEIRRMFKRYLRKEIKDVESLSRYMEQIRDSKD